MNKDGNSGWKRANRVPAELGEDWQHRIRISRIAGERAFANDMEDVDQRERRQQLRLLNFHFRDFPSPRAQDTLFFVAVLDVHNG